MDRALHTAPQHHDHKVSYPRAASKIEFLSRQMS